MQASSSRTHESMGGGVPRPGSRRPATGRAALNDLTASQRSAGTISPGSAVTRTTSAPRDYNITTSAASQVNKTPAQLVTTVSHSKGHLWNRNITGPH